MALQKSLLFPLFFFLPLKSAALITSPALLVKRQATSTSAPIALSTAGNAGDVSWEWPPNYASAIAANSNQGQCSSSKKAKKRSEIVDPCVLTNAQALMHVMASRQDLAPGLLLLSSNGPIFAVGDLRNDLLAMAVTASTSLLFPSAPIAVLLTIATVLLFTVNFIYNNPGVSIVNQTIPAGDIDWTPGVNNAIVQSVVTIDNYVAMTSTQSFKTCPSVTLSTTTVPVACQSVDCRGDGTVCGTPTPAPALRVRAAQNQYAGCPCVPTAIMYAPTYYRLAIFQEAQVYFGSVLAFPACTAFSYTAAPTGAISTACECLNGKQYGTLSGQPTESACAYAASSDLPTATTLSIYSCVTVTDTWTATYSATPRLQVLGSITFTYTPAPSFSTVSSIGCTCSSGIQFPATSTKIDGKDTWACATAPPSAESSTKISNQGPKTPNHQGPYVQFREPANGTFNGTNGTSTLSQSSTSATLSQAPVRLRSS